MVSEVPRPKPPMVLSDIKEGAYNNNNNDNSDGGDDDPDNGKDDGTLCQVTSGLLVSAGLELCHYCTQHNKQLNIQHTS